MSTGHQIHMREIVHEDENMIIEDCVGDELPESAGGGHVVSRQLVFKSRPSCIQSEVNLVYRNEKAKTTDF